MSQRETAPCRGVRKTKAQCQSNNRRGCERNNSSVPRRTKKESGDSSLNREGNDARKESSLLRRLGGFVSGERVGGKVRFENEIGGRAMKLIKNLGTKKGPP